MNTLEQLRRRHPKPYLTLEEFRVEYMPHVRTDAHLKRLISEGKITVKVTQLHKSHLAPKLISLQSVAEWLDTALAQPTEPAADAA